MLNIAADIAAAERMLSDIGRKQLPFATALAINDTAEAVKQVEERDIAARFDRPTPFTQKGIGIKRATKSTLSARVGVKPIQAGYLKRQVTGGTRWPAGRALVVPAGTRLNKYGNIPRRALARAKTKPNVFIAGSGRARSSHLPPGVYQRARKSGGALKMLMAFVPSATYRKQWPFHDIAARRARAVFADNFYTRLRQAIATAR